MSTRIGVLGGTFDPPHVAHLALAEAAREQLQLARVLFLPAGDPPHKRGHSVSPARHRLAMVRLAVRGNRGFGVSTLEMRRTGPSYTVDTLRALAAALPRARHFLILGADSLDAFHTWREPAAILEHATLAVAARPGARARRGSGLRLARASGRRPPCVWIDLPPLDLSARELRARAAAGASLRYLVPDAIAAYIRRHRLYREAG